MDRYRVWETGSGRLRFQPRRSDGALLISIFAMGSGAVVWADTSHLGRPRTYWWRWLAVLRSLIGDWAQTRRENRRLVGVKETEQ